MRNARKYTNAILEQIDEGLLESGYMLEMALNWLSESDVAEMCKRNDVELFEEGEPE